MIDKLYISTFNFDWSKSDSVLINKKNAKELLSGAQKINCHTSIEDLACWHLIDQIVDAATEVYIYDLNCNSKFSNENFLSYGKLFNTLNKFKHKIKTPYATVSIDDICNPLVKRNTQESVLWTAGCSITYGIGVSQNQRYGSIVADYFNTKELCLAGPGRSIEWAANQILMSDIQKNDLVIWGITNVARINVWNNWKSAGYSSAMIHKIPKHLQYWSLDYYHSETNCMLALQAIKNVIHFCKKIQAKLYLVNLLDLSWVGLSLSELSNSIDLTKDLLLDSNDVLQFIDLGVDKMHPGPNQHKQYAETIINFIKEN